MRHNVLALLLAYTVHATDDCATIDASLDKTVPSAEVLSTLRHGHDPEYQVRVANNTNVVQLTHVIRI